MNRLRGLLFTVVLLMAAAASASPVSISFTTTPKNLPAFVGRLRVNNTGKPGGAQILCRWGSSTTAQVSNAKYDFYVAVPQQPHGVTIEKPANCKCAAAGGCPATTELLP